MDGADHISRQAAPFHALSFLIRDPEVGAQAYLAELEAEVARGEVSVLSDAESGARLYYRSLAWDTRYFGVPTFKLEFMCSSLPREPAIRGYERLLARLRSQAAAEHGRFYLFVELPCEAIQAIQALGRAGWRLVETRLTYVNADLQDYEFRSRFKVRPAVEGDIENLREVAAKARNDYDRFHADYYFPEAVADAFLSTFAENSVRGFADVTLVPAVDDKAPDAFLTGKHQAPSAELPNRKIARMILSAVSEGRRGWYVRLISEMSYLFKERGVDVCFMTTQSTNKAVIRTWERLGYAYGRSTHVFVMTDRDL